METRDPVGTTEGDELQSTEASPWMRPFVPPRLLRNAHLQTIVGNLLPRIDTLPEPGQIKGHDGPLSPQKLLSGQHEDAVTLPQIISSIIPGEDHSHVVHTIAGNVAIGDGLLPP